ncbi:MAG: hypothetical protein AAF916_10510 [Planctomycetota bacterium]
MPHQPRVPAYRRRDLKSGRTVAVVTLTDPQTGHRRDVYLGDYGTTASRRRYSETIEKFERGGRVVDAPRRTARPSAPATKQDAIASLVLDHWQAIKQKYTDPDGKLRNSGDNVRRALRELRRFAGGWPIESFGPLKLEQLRHEFIGRGWTRKTCDDRTAAIVRCFRWGVARERVAADQLTALQALPKLDRGESGVREGTKVCPAIRADVETTIPHLPPVVADLVRLQLLTAARGGELFIMRPVDLDMTGPVWHYSPIHHKTERLGKSRMIALGPKAQAIVGARLAGRPVDAFVFDPREQDGKAGARSVQPKYDAASYGRAIARACELAFPLPEELARQRVPAPGRKHERWESAAEWRGRLGRRWPKVERWHRDHRWTPHQLRHLAATETRRAMGLEAAAIQAGHASARMTDAVYAERDVARLNEIALKLG